MPRYVNRKGETVLDFLVREGFYNKPKAKQLLDEGQILINEKVCKKETYKPKKGDVFKVEAWKFKVDV